MNTVNTWLSEYNSLFKTNEKMYRDAVKSFGMSESAFWILYAIRTAPEGVTQREIVNRNFLPPQTINSALKKLESEGYVQLSTGADRRTKRVFLTAKGNELASASADALIGIEVQASEQLTIEEKSDFLRIFNKYISAVQVLLDDRLQEDVE